MYNWSVFYWLVKTSAIFWDTKLAKDVLYESIGNSVKLIDKKERGKNYAQENLKSLAFELDCRLGAINERRETLTIYSTGQLKVKMDNLLTNLYMIN